MREMPEPIKVTLDLRNAKHEGLLTDADGLLFMSALMNSQETALLDRGRLEEAGRLLQVRFNQRREELVQQGKKDEEIIVEISQTMLYKVERDPEERSRIAARIKERFPSIPDSLVRWEGKSNYAINLHLEELMQLIIGIIGPALEQFDTFKTKLPKNPDTLAKPVLKDENKGFAPKPAIAQQPASQENDKIQAAAAQIIELEAQIEKLKQGAIA